MKRMLWMMIFLLFIFVFLSYLGTKNSLNSLHGMTSWMKVAVRRTYDAQFLKNIPVNQELRGKQNVFNNFSTFQETSENPSFSEFRADSRAIVFLMTILAMIGFFVWLFGYRIIKGITWNRWLSTFILLSVGFALFYLSGSSFMFALLVGIAGGILGIFASKFIYYLVSFLLGANFIYLIFFSSFNSNEGKIVITIVSIIIGVVLVTKFHRFIIISFTSFVGSFVFLFSSFVLIDTQIPLSSKTWSFMFGYPLKIVSNSESQFPYFSRAIDMTSSHHAQYKLCLLTFSSSSFFFIWLALALFGILIQYLSIRVEEKKGTVNS